MPSVNSSEVFDDPDPTQQTASQEDAAKLAAKIMEPRAGGTYNFRDFRNTWDLKIKRLAIASI